MRSTTELTGRSAFRHQIKIKSSLYSPYYAKACNELWGPAPRLSAWATQLRRNVATVASRWRHCADLTGPGIESRTSRTDSVRLATELTAGLAFRHNLRKYFCICIVYTSDCTHCMPFSIKKCAKMFFFLCENRENLLAAQIPVVTPLCQIIDAPLSYFLDQFEQKFRMCH